MHLLRLVIEGDEQFSLGYLAQRAGLPASSVHRLLQSMVAEGLVERGEGQSYRVGRELLRLASRVTSRFDPVGAARPILADLVDRWSETAVLCLYSPASRRAVVAAIAGPGAEERGRLRENDEIELPWGSLGQAILANLPVGESEAIFRGVRRSPLAGRPRAKRDTFAEKLQQIRDDGAASYRDEEYDMAGIAAPVFGSDGKILGSLGMIMPLSRYRRETEEDLRADIIVQAAILSRGAGDDN